MSSEAEESDQDNGDPDHLRVEPDDAAAATAVVDAF
jgi:hypothetical protein